jgi:hypothetical protein
MDFTIACLSSTQYGLRFYCTPLHGLRTPNETFFYQNSKRLGLLKQTTWAGKFWGIWDIFKRFISTHFGTVFQ